LPEHGPAHSESCVSKDNPVKAELVAQRLRQIARRCLGTSPDTIASELRILADYLYPVTALHDRAAVLEFIRRLLNGDT
jgi:hypothetical protein